MAGRQCFPSSQSSVPSYDGNYIAVITDSTLSIRSSVNADEIQSYLLPPGFARSCRFIRWYAATRAVDISHDSGRSPRLLLADDARIIVYDVTNPQACAEITGATSLTKLASVDFGYTPDEILVLSDFGWKLQIWSLKTKRAVEIKDPKSVASSYSYRPRTGHLALLTRPAAHDILLIMASDSHEILSTWELATVDARGVKYSPDGNWLVVWDTASAGCRVLLLTADGHHFKTFSIPDPELSLGVSCVHWGPRSECVAIGDCGQSVTVLSKNTFVPRFIFTHVSTIDIPDTTVWQEEIGPSLGRGYAEARQPAVSPSQESFPTSKEKSVGVGPMKFNTDGTLLASKSSATPSTLWIHSLETGQALTALIHHSPITLLRWHPAIPDLLLLQCATPEPIVYLWQASWPKPRIYNLPLKAPVGQSKASWLSSANNTISFLLSNSHQTAIERLTMDGETKNWDENGQSLGPEAMFDEGNSLDLSPVRMSRDETTAVGLSTQLGHNLEVEDTFQFRRHGQAVT
ncbi:MAG: hypothetical protein Q9212_007146 [Teloschistes hypoglaucus]